MPSTTTALLSASCLIFTTHLVKRYSKGVRLLVLDSLWESIVWSFRITFFKHQFPNEMKLWGASYASSEQMGDTWELLRPFFESKGYTLYKQQGRYASSFPCSAPSVAPALLRSYPYARTLDDDEEFELVMGSHYIWAARDTLQRDVVIKLISEVDNPSNEWLLLQKFNHVDLRSDPRNQTIHVIEYITFANFVFAVMPRWDSAFLPPFSTVAELMDVAKSYLEIMDFLHSHRVAHQDFSLGNAGMNLYGTHICRRVATGVRNRQDVKYIIYDFGYSLIYPMDTDIEKVESYRRLRYYHAPDPTPPYNPFKSDVAMMGGLLHGHVMHVAKYVPEVEGFFDHMMDLDEKKRPSASEALQEFMQIYDHLTAEQLCSPVACIWTNRYQSPLNI